MLIFGVKLPIRYRFHEIWVSLRLNLKWILYESSIFLNLTQKVISGITPIHECKQPFLHRCYIVNLFAARIFKNLAESIIYDVAEFSSIGYWWKISCKMSKIYTTASRKSRKKKVLKTGNIGPKSNWRQAKSTPSQYCCNMSEPGWWRQILCFAYLIVVAWNVPENTNIVWKNSAEVKI